MSGEVYKLVESVATFDDSVDCSDAYAAPWRRPTPSCAIRHLLAGGTLQEFLAKP